jgi:hypothetical protein
MPRQDLFYFPPFIFKCILIVQGFRLGISHMCILSFNQINPLYHLLFLYCLDPLLFNSF